jgi:VWFA-related protein
LVIDVNLRNLNVFVEDESGDPVLDLTADDFEVLENGQSKPVKHLTLETEPVAVGLVLDRSSSISPVKKKVDEAVRHALEAVGPKDQVFLVTFAGTDKLIVGRTTSRKNIVEAIRKTKLGFGTRVYDALVHSLQYLSTSSLERKIVIVFSDGADHYSTHTFEQLLGGAAFYATPIYMVGYVGDDSRTWSDQGRRQIRDEFEQLAAKTGGKAYFPTYSADGAAIARQILVGMRYEYRIGFYSSGPFAESSDVQVKFRDRSRRLTIRISRPVIPIMPELL